MAQHPDFEADTAEVLALAARVEEEELRCHLARQPGISPGLEAALAALAAPLWARSLGAPRSCSSPRRVQNWPSCCAPACLSAWSLQKPLLPTQLRCLAAPAPYFSHIQMAPARPTIYFASLRPWRMLLKVGAAMRCVSIACTCAIPGRAASNAACIPIQTQAHRVPLFPRCGTSS